MAIDDQPVPVARASTDSVAAFRVPAAPQGYGPAKWLAAGGATTIGGLTIPGGMIYVGTSLPTPGRENDPCLIDPSLPLAAYGDYAVREMGYWPSYSAISPFARRAYLQWLADGRRDPQANIGYVFLFFYGLERRAILDAAADDSVKAEWPIIAAELRRLLCIYGDVSGSFKHYAGSLLDWVSLAEHPEQVYLKPVPELPRTFELPLYIRVALGQAARDGAPIPAELALAWVKLNPAVSLRTPATRCVDEFDALFAHEYRRAFGEGMVLTRNRTMLKLVHRPASAGFRGYGELHLTFGDVPDITAQTAPVKRLQALVDDATRALESFSRYILKNPHGRSTLDGILLLPAILWPDVVQESLQSLKGQIADGNVSLPFGELLAELGPTMELNKARVVALAEALESNGIGIEPDVLGGARAPKPGDTVVLFATEARTIASQPTPAYQAALLTVQLASAVAGADGEFGPTELSHVQAQIGSWSHLTSHHVRRLMAHVELLVAQPVSLPALKKRLDGLDPAAKESIARFMATVAQADGMVSPTEVRMLERVYKALGVEPEQVFTDVHAAATGAAPASVAGARRQRGFKLDPEKIAALQRDTAAVSALLAGIFQEDEVPAPPPPTIEPEAGEAKASGLLDLDEAHSALARLLLSRPEWAKNELEDAAADLELMLAGALETINEAALDKHDVTFVEGEDPVTVNPELLEVLAA